MGGLRSVEYIDGSRNLPESPGMNAAPIPVRCHQVFWFEDLGDRHAARRSPPAGCDRRVGAGAAPSSFSITGMVKSGNTPIPGATVTATNSSTEAKTTTSTDINGAYTLQVAAAGKYQLRVEMPAFAPTHQGNRRG